MTNSMYKTIVVLVIGILIGYFFGVSTAGNNEDMDTNDKAMENGDAMMVDEGNHMEDEDASENPVTSSPNVSVANDGDVFVPDVMSRSVNEGAIFVSDQPVAARVAIDKVVLPQDSWIAIHEYREGNLDQFIIGAHRRSAGVYENLSLWINREMEPNARYIIALHQDDGVEGFDFRSDTPRINPDGTVTAAFFGAF